MKLSPLGICQYLIINSIKAMTVRVNYSLTICLNPLLIKLKKRLSSRQRSENNIQAFLTLDPSFLHCGSQTHMGSYN